MSHANLDTIIKTNYLVIGKSYNINDPLEKGCFSIKGVNDIEVVRLRGKQHIFVNVKYTFASDEGIVHDETSIPIKRDAFLSIIRGDNIKLSLYEDEKKNLYLDYKPCGESALESL